MARRALALLIAATLAACGTTYSPNYGRRDGGGDGEDYAPDGYDIGDTAQPRVDGGVHPGTGHGPPYPVVLHHGFAGWRDFGPINYFYNVARDLRARGEAVYEAEVAPYQAVEVRSAQLAAFVDRVLLETGAARVVLVAHSQGGLDARHMISSRGYGDRVALLATFATPHRGTRIADAIVGNVSDVSDEFIDAVTTIFGYAYNEVRTRADLRRAVQSLTEAGAVEFNRQNPDDPRVVYWSWSGRSNRRTGATQCAGARIANDDARVDDAFWALYPFAVYLEQRDPQAHVNDGLVEVANARWGLWMGCVPADHFDEIGQIARSGPVPGSGFYHIEFYRDVVRRVREAGF